MALKVGVMSPSSYGSAAHVSQAFYFADVRSCHSYGRSVSAPSKVHGEP